MALTVNLEKSKAALALNLQKAGILTPPVVECAFDLDVSGSFDDEHRSGLTDDLLARLVPWGMTFDPDNKLDVFTFSNTPEYAVAVGAVDASNYQGYVRKNIVNKVKGYGQFTDYSYVIEKNLQSFGWLPQDAEAPKRPGLMGRLFGGRAESAPSAAPVSKKRSLIIFVTDGANDDKARTEKVLRESEGRGDEIYFLFLGISNQNVDFSFLERLGDKFKNTGFLRIRDMRGFVEKSDEELNSLLLTSELIDWLKK